MDLEIRLEGIAKHFGEFTAVRSFSEVVHKGDRISVLGHNGAGKSTLLNMVATLSRPTEGEIRYILGEKELKERTDIRKTLTYLSHEPMLYPDLTAAENLRFVAGMYNKELDDDRLAALLEMVGMSFVGDRLFRSCSRGMQQRLAIARALLPEPHLLLLDEPFSGLDSEGTRRLKGLFTKEDLTWLLVTHDLPLAYEMANRFWIMRRGKLVNSVRKEDVTYEAYMAMSQAATTAGVMT